MSAIDEPINTMGMDASAPSDRVTTPDHAVERRVPRMKDNR